jgi:hypothetical protein
MLQDGMLYLFNLPSSQAVAAAAATAADGAAAQQPAAAGRAAVGAPVAGSELMVKGLPDWEPLASQISRRFVEAIMSKLEEQQQQHGVAAAAAAGLQAAGTEQQQQQQQQQGYAKVAAAVAAAKQYFSQKQPGSQQQQQQQQQHQGQLPELWMAGEMSAAMQEAPGSVAQAEAAIAAGERLLGFAVKHLADSCPAAAQLKPRFQFGSQQQQHCFSSWQQRARNVAQLLQVRASA